MTYEEALNMMAKAEIRYYGEMTIADEIIELKNKCCEALEKQIPIKPINVRYHYTTFDCPNCKETIFTTEELNTHKYCLYCGQALDWSEEE